MKLDIEFYGVLLPIELAQICSPAAAVVYAVLNDTAENGITHLSNNEIGKRAGVPGRSVPSIIAKLEKLGVVERHYNPGYATSYYVKNILPETKSAKQTPTEVPAEPEEPVRPSELKPGYRFYGEYRWIALTNEEYESLVKTYSKSKVDNTIDIIDNNIEARKMYNHDIKHGAYGKAYVKEWIEKDIRKLAPNDVIKQQEMREIGKYTEERKEIIDKYLDLID